MAPMNPDRTLINMEQMHNATRVKAEDVGCTCGCLLLMAAPTLILVALILLLTGTAKAAVGARMEFDHGAKMTFDQPAQKALAAPPADTIWLHLVGEPVSRRVQRALVDQITEEVAPAWHVPQVRFGTSGVPVDVTSIDTISAECGDEASGCHSYLNSVGGTVGAAEIFVEDFKENDDGAGGSLNRQAISSVLSHEIIEMLVDGDGTEPEACDPVSWQTYSLEGVVVSDFTLPSNWHAGGWPYDFRHVLRHARTTAS